MFGNLKRGWLAYEKKKSCNWKKFTAVKFLGENWAFRLPEGLILQESPPARGKCSGKKGVSSLRARCWKVRTGTSGAFQKIEGGPFLNKFSLNFLWGRLLPGGVGSFSGMGKPPLGPSWGFSEKV